MPATINQPAAYSPNVTWPGFRYAFRSTRYPKQFRKALAVAGITDHVRPHHDMRHTALPNLDATGASPIAVMATAGHRSMSTTNRYLHLAGVVFRADADALERSLLGARTTASQAAESSTHLSASRPTSGDPSRSETRLAASG
jgi:integrase